MLTASSIVIPDLELRQYLGIVNVVPDTSVFVALALTTLPLAARRRFPWPVFLFCLVSFLGLQNAFNGFSLTIAGPVVALYTIASERGRAETYQQYEAGGYCENLDAAALEKSWALAVATSARFAQDGIPQLVGGVRVAHHGAVVVQGRSMVGCAVLAHSSTPLPAWLGAMRRFVLLVLQ